MIGTRHDLYDEMMAITGTTYWGQEPYQFDKNVIGDLGELWEEEADAEYKRLTKAIADAWSEWASISNGGKI